MKVVDELMTPGCPQCAVKHLSAALYHMAHHVAEGNDGGRPDPYMVCVCTAYINLVEVRAGYVSHLWYAVGALVRAEEHWAPRLGECVAREARLMLEEFGAGALIDALNCIKDGTVPDHTDWAVAHFDEARRELPAMADQMRMDDLVGSIERVRDEYFSLPEVTVAEGEKTPKEKEPEMATAKKKAPVKAAKASKVAKAAKCAKCACKGGKTKKGK